MNENMSDLCPQNNCTYNEQYDNDVQYDKESGGYDVLTILNIVIEIAIALAAIIGNLLVLFIIAKFRHLQKVTYYYIASLAAADLLVGCIAIPFAIITGNNLPRDFNACLFMNSAIVIFTQISIFGLLFIAIERCAAIRNPYSYQETWTPKVSVALIAITWTTGTVLGMVPLFGWNLGPPEEPGCSFVMVIDLKYMVYFNFFGCVLTPLIIMFAVYGYIFCIVRKQLKKIASVQIGGKFGENPQKRKFFKELKAAKSLSVILFFFAACWLPLHILNTLTVLCPTVCTYPFSLLQFTIWLSHANSAFNPVLYAWASKDFRFALKRIMGMKIAEEDIPEASLTNNNRNSSENHSIQKY